MNIDERREKRGEGSEWKRGVVGHPVKVKRLNFRWNLVHMWDRAPDVAKYSHGQFKSMRMDSDVV